MPILPTSTLTQVGRRTPPALRRAVLALATAVCGLTPALAQVTTGAEQLQRWQLAAGAPGQAARGQAFFALKAPGGDLSCASCHGMPPTTSARHASTGKAVEPLAPAFNPQRFTDTAKVDKWFRRNCKDVFSRECSAAEKADVMAYLLSLKR